MFKLELFRLIPRKYRSAAARLCILLILLLIICLFLSPDASTTGAGRADESLFRFDYEANENDEDAEKIVDYDVIPEEVAVAPAIHRGKDFKKMAESHEEDGNFTESPLLQPEVSVLFLPIRSIRCLKRLLKYYETLL